MIYTIGHTESYEKGLEDLKEKFRKLGKTDTYPGGIVFKSKRSAEQYINNFLNQKYSVYGILADWKKDTYIVNDTRLLLKTSRIVNCKEIT